MIPLESLVLEKQCHYHGEDGQRNHFLNDFQLYEIERASVVYETDSVRRRNIRRKLRPRTGV